MNGPKEHEIIRRIEAILNRLKSVSDTLSKKYPVNDLRLALISLPGNILHSYLFHFAMAEYTICRREWWQIAYQKNGPSEKDQQAIANLDSMTKHAFFAFFMSRQEWNFRKLVSYLKPGTKIKGASFKNVYDAVLQKLNLEQYIPLMDICRHIRNSIHSNGYHIPQNGQNETIVWNGKTYQFKHLKPIDFMTHDTWFELVEDNVQLIEAILANTNLASIPVMEDALQ